MRDFITLLRKNDIHIRIEDGELTLKYPKGDLDLNLLAKIKENKFLLIDYLNKVSDDAYVRIPAALPAESYVLSSSQRRLWLLSQLDAGNTAYNMPGVYTFEGELNDAGLDSAFFRLIARHEILRTVFREDVHGDIRQYILSSEELDFHLLRKDLRAAGNPDLLVKNLIREAFQHPFDLENGPLLRACLYQLEDHRWIFTYEMHHIISDGWSMGVLIEELFFFYNTHLKSDHSALLPLKLQYKDYASWQQTQLNDGSLSAHKTYWLEQFSGVLPVLELAGDKVRPAVKTYHGDILIKPLAEGLTKALHALVQEQGATLFMGLMAALNGLLFRYTGQEDQVIGSPIVGREHADLEDQIGFYVNTLALRSRFSGKDSFTKLLNQVKQVTLAAYEHQVYPFDELVEALELKRDMSRNPLFDVGLVLQNGVLAQDKLRYAEIGQLTVKRAAEAGQEISKFDLSFGFTEVGSALELSLEYNIDIYTKETAEQLCRHFEQLLSAMLAAPDTSIDALVYLDVSEQNKVLHDFNAGAGVHSEEKTVLALFEAQVKKTPEAIALTFENTSLTYLELSHLSSQFAAYLSRTYHPVPNDLIALKLPRTEWMVIGMLGILKTGAAYLPIDPDYPQERLDYIIADSSCKVLVDEEELRRFQQALDQPDDTEFLVEAKPSDLAYLIYTSGSTGHPKGVMVSHGNLSNFLGHVKRNYAPDAPLSLPFVASNSFDISVFQLFCSLLSGGRSVLLTKDQVQDPAQFVEVLKGVNAIDTVPGVYQGLVSYLTDQGLSADFAHISHLFIGGDSIANALLHQLSKIFSHAKLTVTYGPTEGTIFCTHLIYNPGEINGESKGSIIGKPIDGAKIYLTDQQGLLCPVGVIGELCIGGKGLSQGYLNRPELTSAQFVDCLFEPGQQMYKTGDLGRWLPDGEIEFMGRKDNQVKIRGYRIELGEIDASLRKYAKITSAVVLAKLNQSGTKDLVAYVTGKEELNVAEIRSYLGNHLPAYMVPSQYIQVDHIPLTENGKIATAVLLENVDILGGVHYQEAGNRIEKELTEIWQEVLGPKIIGIKDNFFELGGDSIKAIQVISRLKKKGYLLSIQEILKHPVIADLSILVKTDRFSVVQEIIQGESTLSPAQKSFFEDDNVDKHHFNQSVLLRTSSPVDEDGLKKVLNKIVQHHDALRMIFIFREGHWIQRNLGIEQGYDFEVIENADDELFEQRCNDIQSSFNMTTGPLLKVCLFKGKTTAKLLIVIHHMVVDGVSWRIFLEDLANLYQQHLLGKALILPLKTHSFLHWQAKMLEYSKTELLKKEQVYWNSERQGQKLVPDQVSGTNLMKDAATLSFLLTKEATGALTTKCYKPYRTGTNEILITALSLAIHEKFRLENIAIMLEGHGREAIDTNIDVTRTIGCFTSLYPVWIDLKHSNDNIRQLIEVKEHLNRIPGKGIGFGILQLLSGNNELPNPEISFNYLGDITSGITPDMGNGVFELSAEERGREISAERYSEFLLNITAIITDGQLKLSIGYSNKQFMESSINELLSLYQKYLLELIAELSAEERLRLTPIDLSYSGLSLEEVDRLNQTGDLEDVYALSPLQEGMYFHWSNGLTSSAYFSQMTYRLKGKLNVPVLEESYHRLVSRHAVLRTCFMEHAAGKLLQLVRKEVKHEFVYVGDISDHETIAEYKLLDRAKGFDLNSGAQMRLAVMKSDHDVFELIWSHHHILMDGWCMSILTKEFFHIYYSLLQGQAPALARVSSYSDYINWLGALDRDKSIAYWKNYLSGYLHTTTIPGKISMEQAVAYQEAECAVQLSGALREQINTVCRKLGVTEQTLIRCAWACLLGKYNNSDDIVFGSVVSGRPAGIDGIEQMVGLFINTIPVRIKVAAEGTFESLITAIHHDFIEGADHHYLQLAEIQTRCSGTILFDHILVFENYPSKNIQENRAEGIDQDEVLTVLKSETVERTNYGFTVTVIPGDALTLKFNYNGNLYDSRVVKQLQGHFLATLKFIAANLSQPAKSLDFLSEGEKQQLIYEFNDTAVVYPETSSIIALFEEQVKKSPAAVALAFEDTILTYEELDIRSGQLANYLKDTYHIGRNDLIGIKLNVSELMVISILAILKTGGAYVPIDIAYPQHRIDFILSEIGCKVLIDEDELQKFNEFIPKKNTSIHLIRDAHDLAYVMYTSGSSGKPKGVMIENLSVIRLVKSANYVKLNEDTVILSSGSVSFDAVTFDYWGALLNGGKVVLCKQDVLLNVNLLTAEIEKKEVNVIFFTTGLFNQLIDTDINIFKGLKSILTGGERVSPVHVHKLQQTYPLLEIIHCYGPTENTTFSLTYPVESGSTEIPIGKPISNTEVYIIDRNGALSPIAAVGELYLAGPGLARGYLNNAGLTDEKFIDHLFKPEGKMYKTGDLGRWLPDGNIDFVGRADDQVKIRGYRIELGEIEKCLEGYPDITSAVVIAKSYGTRTKELIGYFTGSETLNIPDLRRHMADFLPLYMIPAHFVCLEKMPLNINGKVDLEALPIADHFEMKAESEYLAPRNEIESKLMLLWQEVLQREDIGVRDNFFLLGGHSLKALNLLHKIRNEYEINISIQEVFMNPTVEFLAAEINRKKWIETDVDFNAEENITVTI
ncbi:non-ribosomal peptide synthase domain TIGR01720/amino acid adenylation domain-containing protein [Pedobacter steynii]|uniref:Non-ribosomal peptide synthase domain TIGR01720/amino acid adenylation domain-containing protein n=1 Tax=Pedobacter steynii TaxID=430522 RepID=A0A1H0IX30_9SPHI|nr:non-ribosomal peptide synthetase [Pedobacter steynii]NQX42957.1 non-ribosomal peptide synthetase [Pedobacter steynii]SDO35631.1 non-ribosomal peptide synthase domain TIGR01720/amino acid adenylation domain-containing protein [Pedobacter steynii]